MRRRRKNPPEGISPVLLVGGAVALYLLLKPKSPSAPVDGLGTAALGFSIGKSFKKLTSGIAQHSIVGKIVKKIAPKPLRKVLAKIDPTAKRRPAPLPPATAETVNEYQDENGNVISEAEYNRRMAEIAAANNAPPPAPPAQNSGPIKLPPFQLPPSPTFTPAPAPQQASQPFDFSAFAPQASSPASGGGGTLLPSSQFTPAPGSADQAAAAPAPGKFNPIIAAGALIAVPLVAMLTGGK
jgi:hypothetical protein